MPWFEGDQVTVVGGVLLGLLYGAGRMMQEGWCWIFRKRLVLVMSLRGCSRLILWERDDGSWEQEWEWYGCRAELWSEENWKRQRILDGGFSVYCGIGGGFVVVLSPY